MQAGQAKEQRLNPDRQAPDTAVLVRRAQTGDQEAFGALYRLHVDRIHGLCLRLTADRDTAARLTQDAFVRAWRNIASFRGDSQLITWLHRLTVNVVLDHRRSERRRLNHQVNMTDADGLERLAVVHPAPVGMRQDLEQAIAGLPAGARAMFVLHEIEGYRLREIAEMSGVAVGTVKAQLHRARRLLREVLK
jgi:RNA polymerase sigma-70 factor, ECF subfamily